MTESSSRLTTGAATYKLHDSDGEIDLRAYFKTISHYKWNIISFVISVSLLALLILYSLKPVYQGKTTLLLESESAKVVSIEEVYGLSGANREYYQTQYKILSSRAVALRVIQQLNLGKHPDFVQDSGSFPGVDWSAILPGATRQGDGVMTEEQRQNMLFETFSNKLQIEPVRNSQLVNILFDSYDAKLAADVANQVARAYIGITLEGKLEMTQQASRWLTQRLDKLRTKLEESEKKLQAYVDQEKLVDVKGFKSLTARRLDEITNKLVEARRKRTETETLYRQVQVARQQSASRLDSLPAVLEHPLVQGFKETVSSAERKINELSKRYGPKHPKMIQAQSELRAVRRSLSGQIENVLRGVEKEYEVARVNQASLERELRASTAEVQGINKKRYKLDVLQREVEANRNLYDLFLTRFKETSESGGMGTANARVIDPAITPPAPYKPKKMFIMLIVVAISIVVAIAVVFVYEHLNNTVKSGADVEEKTGLSMLGILPKLKVGSRQDKSVLRAFLNDDQTVFAESVRTIRTGVLLSNLDEAHSIILVTSSAPGEGKSTTSMNLAHAMSQMSRVLLIDADMRRPSIAKACRLGRRPKGLAQYAAGTAKISEAVHEISGSQLYVMPAGIIPPNPLELLSSRKFQQALQNLAEAFDHIVIDSAPAMVVSDSLVLSRYAHGVIYVIKADATPLPVVETGIRRLRQADARFIGAVLNMPPTGKSGSYGYDYHYGGYYTAYTRGKT